jgi:hypothetical protein
LAACGLRDPIEICGEQRIDTTVPAVALHVGSAPRYEADQEIALLGGDVERAAGVAITGIPELIDSAREQLSGPEDVDDGVRDVELAGQVVFEVVHPVAGHERNVPVVDELSLALDAKQRSTRNSDEGRR